MDLWRQCTAWLIRCRVLPQHHRLTWENAQVCDLAQALRDGVLLCQLLSNLMPQSINMKDINLRPQKSQFFCLKNIQSFLHACEMYFGLKKSDLFDAFDLFDLQDFAKVIDTLSMLSYCTIATNKGIEPFPLEQCLPNEDIYMDLSEEIDCMEEEHDIYDCVEDQDDEGDDIYEDLMRTDEPPQTHRVSEVDKRACCLQEISQTEEKYSNTLESIIQHFMRPLQRTLRPQDIDSIFMNVEDLAVTHRGLLEEVHHSIHKCGSSNLHQVFLAYKERLLIYGRYCSQVEAATRHLEQVSTASDNIKVMLEECSQRANNGRFCLRDLLMVPMQRVLKYHLLLQELVKHTNSQEDKGNLCKALDAMRDLAQCVNEVKRDNEILRQISTFQLSIENMQQSLAHYGRPKIDGELKISSSEKKSKQDRYAFLFDKALVVCKKKSGDSMELKKFLELQHYQLRNETTGEKDKKWCHSFHLDSLNGQCCFSLYMKTVELKNKWLEQFNTAISNMFPDNRKANSHDFEMHCFGQTISCKACNMLLRGIFFQGYSCTRCRAAAHKECLDRVPPCQRNFISLPPVPAHGGPPSSENPGNVRKNKSRKPSNNRNPNPALPKMAAVQEYYGLPPPPSCYGRPLHFVVGHIIDLIQADVDEQWWEGKSSVTGDTGWFPCNRVQTFNQRRNSDLDSHVWFAGNIDRNEAKNLLMSRTNGTFLLRQKDGGEFAISIKFNLEVKHIKIKFIDGFFHLNDKRAFKGILELVDYYQENSLKDCFKDIDMTLQFPYKDDERSLAQATSPFRNTPSPFPAKSEKSLGWARALYDFSARDQSELSLCEGDEVKIISKETTEGWWMGEAYGQVGLFPSNYVKEDESEYC